MGAEFPAMAACSAIRSAQRFARNSNVLSGGQPGDSHALRRAIPFRTSQGRMPLPPLSPEQLVKPRHFEARIALIFASLFVSTGINLPYFPLWLEANGFNPERIAVILAAPMFLRVVTTPLITAYADRATDRAEVLLLLVAASLVISCGYFLPTAYGIVLGVTLALSIVWTPQGPLADSLALSGVRRFGSNYSHMRIWGSIAFLSANFGGGAAVLAAVGGGPSGRTEAFQPSLRAVRGRCRRHQCQPRLHVWVPLDLLAVDRARQYADGVSLGRRRHRRSRHLPGLHARLR
jgi:hypothetical protein